ncbi:MAG: hypothetical protein M1433_01800 [Candidatus Parvarchaeota archaeon]|nr:hypothetical protein [Candidatus Parvarchaeota archaeon]
MTEDKYHFSIRYIKNFGVIFLVIGAILSVLVYIIFTFLAPAPVKPSNTSIIVAIAAILSIFESIGSITYLKPDKIGRPIVNNIVSAITDNTMQQNQRNDSFGMQSIGNKGIINQISNVYLRESSDKTMLAGKPNFIFSVLEFRPANDKSAFISIKNSSEGIAAGLKCMIKIDYDGKILLEGRQLPARRLDGSGNPSEVYDGVDLYPDEKIEFQLLHLGPRRPGQPKNLLEITTYPWKWTSDAFAELNSYDKEELKVNSEHEYNIEIKAVDKLGVNKNYKLKLIYDGNNFRIEPIG